MRSWGATVSEQPLPPAARQKPLQQRLSTAKNKYTFKSILKRGLQTGSFFFILLFLAVLGLPYFA